MDLNAAALEGEGEALISAFEVTQDGNQIWRELRALSTSPGVEDT